MRHPNIRPGGLLQYVVCIGEQGIDNPGSLDCDMNSCEAVGTEYKPVVTSSMVKIPGEPPYLELTHPEDFLDDLARSLISDGPPGVVKSGPVCDRGHLEALAGFLEEKKPLYICDPEMFCPLSENRLDGATAEFVKRHLLPLARLITPDIGEAEQMLGAPINNRADMKEAAERLLVFGPKWVLLKGGQLAGGAEAVDYFTDGGQGAWLSAPRLDPQRVSARKGRVANMAAAIAAGLAAGLPMHDALALARSIIQAAYRADGEKPPAFPCAPADFPAAWPDGRTPATDPFPPLDFALPAFYPIVDGADWMARIAPLGIAVAQLRIKNLSGGALEEEIRRGLAEGDKHGVRIFVNDYWELAVKHGAYGVHLGQSDLQTADIGAVRRAGLRLGLSTHCYFEAAVAHALRPSYIALGPVYPTKIKSMDFAPQGLETVRLWRTLFDAPLVAIGGITLEKADGPLSAGADMVSVISDISQNPDPEVRVKNWLSVFPGV